MKGSWKVWSLAALLLACSNGGGGQYVSPDAGNVEDLTTTADVVEQVDTAAVDVVEELIPMPDIIPSEVSAEEWALLYGEECPTEEMVGLVEAFIPDLDKNGDQYQYIYGRIQDKVKAHAVFDELSVQGDCRLLLRAAPQCTPKCIEQKEQCNLDETCEPLDELQYVGPLFLPGLNYHVAILPDKNDDYYMYTDKKKGVFMDGPIFDEGAFLAAHAAEGMYGPFTLQGRGVARLVMIDPPVTVSQDMDLELLWETSDGPGEIFVQVSLQNHATTPVTIQCRLEDTGAMSVPSSYVNKLLEAHEGGTIAVTVQRRTVDAEHFKTGCIEFQVYSDWNEDLLLK